MSVGSHLLAAFGACTAILAIVVVQEGATSMERERDHTRQALLAITQETASSNTDYSDELAEVGASYGSDPRVQSLDPAECFTAFSGLANALADMQLHLIAADGRVVCSVHSPSLVDPAPLEVGPWLDTVIDSAEPLVLDPVLDPRTGRPSVLMAAAVVDPATGRAIAAMAATVPTDDPIAVPDTAPEGAVIVLLDAERDLVLAASPNAPVQPGDRAGGTALGRGFRPGRSVQDVDGVQRMYEAVTVADNGWHVLAGVPTEVALAKARDQFRRNLIGGGITLGIVFLLGLLLHRRLARPIRRLGKAIAASLGGDRDARAPIAGPAELAQVAAVFNDLLEERHEREADLWRSARTDSLTGLPNRTALEEHLTEALRRLVDDPSAGVVVLFLDLDRFKHINDAYGHAMGDSVLVAIGARLRESLPEVLLARFGGDEYVLVSTGAHDLAGAEQLAGKVNEILTAPVRIDGADHFLSGSVGIAVAQAGDTAEDLIRNADTAMYRSKEDGAGAHAVFDEAMRHWVLNRSALESDLHRALERDELSLVYQPKFEIPTGALCGFEALLRWNHPTRGPVPPGEFIPVAEDSGLISAIGLWVLEQAATQAASWRRERGGLGLPVAVNLAARQLANPHLPEQVATTLERCGAVPADLTIEVTESAVLLDTDGVSRRLRMLRNAGIRISVDDFGTGYSSLSYLQRLPIDELKIDRAFIASFPGARSSTAIVGSIIDLAHAVGLTVVAEGVELEDQLRTLEALGCDLAQGYHLARPESAADATERIRAAMRGLVPR